MNKQREKDVKKVVSELEILKQDIENITDKEEEAFDNIPESLQESDRAMRSTECIEVLHDATDLLDDLISKLGEI